MDDEVIAALHELSDPRPFGDKIKSAIDRASRASGLSYWRTFDLWYGKARRVEQYERDAIADAMDKKRREAARNEIRNLRNRIEVMEARLAQNDPDFHRETLDALGYAMRGSR